MDDWRNPMENDSRMEEILKNVYACRVRNF